MTNPKQNSSTKLRLKIETNLGQTKRTDFSPVNVNEIGERERDRKNGSWKPIREKIGDGERRWKRRRSQVTKIFPFLFLL